MNPVLNPRIPCSIPIPGGMKPGKLIKIQGFIPHYSNSFAVNLVSGPEGNVPLYISPRFGEFCIIRNTIQNGLVGYEERSGAMPIRCGENFELLVLCDHQNFKIAFNGQHFTEFNHRLPYYSINDLRIDGEVNIHSVNFDENVCSSRNIGLVIPPSANYGPAPGLSPSPYQAPYPRNVPNYSDSIHPNNNNIYPPQTGVGGYGNQHSLYPQQPSTGYAGGYPVYGSQTSYQHSQGGYPHSPKSHKSAGLLDKAGMAVASVLGTTALNKAVKKKIKGQKKALKYGLPLAGAGLGAYALTKGIKHGFRRSSSSSSSSSD